MRRTKYCSTQEYGKLSTPMIPSVPPKMLRASIIRIAGQGIHEAHDSEIDPSQGKAREEKQGADRRTGHRSNGDRQDDRKAQIFVQERSDVGAGAYEKSASQGDEPHVMSQEVKAQGKKGIKADIGNDPLPVKARHHERQQKQPHNEH